jgi:hypothetical protein
MTKPNAAPDPRKVLGVLAFSVIAVQLVAGGPWGLEESVREAGPGPVLAAMILLPLLFALPQALMTAELASLCVYCMQWHVAGNDRAVARGGAKRICARALLAARDLALKPSPILCSHAAPATTLHSPRPCVPGLRKTAASCCGRRARGATWRAGWSASTRWRARSSTSRSTRCYAPRHVSRRRWRRRRRRRRRRRCPTHALLSLCLLCSSPVAPQYVSAAWSLAVAHAPAAALAAVQGAPAPAPATLSSAASAAAAAAIAAASPTPAVRAHSAMGAAVAAAVAAHPAAGMTRVVRRQPWPGSRQQLQTIHNSRLAHFPAHPSFPRLFSCARRR